MANLKEIRNRISSIGSTMKITSAMKMVSAAKLKKAQDAITNMRPYANKLTELLQNLSATLEGDQGSVYATKRHVDKVLIISITSNRGLCGAFNTNVVKETRSIIEKHYEGKEVQLFTIGKKGHEVLKKTIPVFENNNHIFDHLTFEQTALLAEQIMQTFVDGKFDKIDLIYNRFKNAGTQIPTYEAFLPIQSENSGHKMATDYLFEPSKEVIVEQLIPKSLKMQLFKALERFLCSRTRRAYDRYAQSHRQRRRIEKRSDFNIQQSPSSRYYRRDLGNCGWCRGVERVVF
jgi:F-type H+-transporting ATPase subunit gamma